MVFSSLAFLYIFLPIFLLGYHLTKANYKNLFTLAASLLFYAWGAPYFIFIALFSIVIDFFIVKSMASSSKNKRRFFLSTSVILNVGLLLYFKYANFFIENVNLILGLNNSVQWTEIILPIGISFFTFQKLSYSIDIYRNKETPLEKLSDYALYILLFPQLIAGPIVRYKEIADQLIKRNFYDYNQKFQGIYRFCIGLGKKVLIANTLGLESDLVFGLDPSDLNASIAWFGIICYTFQIYFDFSAYSDMAIGLGLFMGFRFPENFNCPYIAQSITEFWRRWHITLSNWMRDYLYIPLGGNQVSTNRLYVNLWLVFLISGLWHGASWNFVLWGAFHGFFLIADRLFLKKLTAKVGMGTRVLLTFFIVVMSWVLFRSDTIEYARHFYKALFSFNFSHLYLFLDNKVVTTLIVASILSFILMSKKVTSFYNHLENSHSPFPLIIKGLLSICLLILASASLASSDFNPFIYFRF